MIQIIYKPKHYINIIRKWDIICTYNNLKVYLIYKLEEQWIELFNI